VPTAPRRYKPAAARAATGKPTSTQDAKTRADDAYALQGRTADSRAGVVALLSKRRTLRDAIVLHELLGKPTALQQRET
jgi:hypothetical protein